MARGLRPLKREVVTRTSMARMVAKVRIAHRKVFGPKVSDTEALIFRLMDREEDGLPVLDNLASLRYSNTPFTRRLRRLVA